MIRDAKLHPQRPAQKGMIMRILYALLLRLHPRRFRERFAADMAIFDEARSFWLLGDVLLSLFANGPYVHNNPAVLASTATPYGMFQTLDTYTPAGLHWFKAQS